MAKRERDLPSTRIIGAPDTGFTSGSAVRSAWCLQALISKCKKRGRRVRTIDESRGYRGKRNPDPRRRGVCSESSSVVLEDE